MKTLGEFLQRLEDDSGFEKKAQAYNNGDELMAFVKGEGYDFTLEQLTRAFKERADLPPRAKSLAPARPNVSASTPPRPEVTTFPGSPAALPQGETSATAPKNLTANFPREQPRQELPELPGAMPPKNPEEKSTGGLFGGGGGRHRGLSPERLKNVVAEDS
jgi:predicted ribosomally synthesized peptide with nif11-like leader